MTTNDHTVPQMYLRRFARQPAGRGHLITMARVDDLSGSFVTNVKNVAAVKGFYWGTTPDGVPHHEVDGLLQKIETAATPAFNAMLDDHLYALPQRWPLEHRHRVRLAWWIAAQLLRTTRQRRRLAHLQSDRLEAPRNVRSFADHNEHLHFISDQISRLARIVYNRPWGLTFSAACLLTSDAPVVIVNGHDYQNQLLSAWYWDLVLPLDPHRLLILPGKVMREEDPRKRSDHMAKVDGGIGFFFSQMLYDAADSYVFYHPHHSPLHMIENRGRLLAPWAGDEQSEGPGYVFDYEVLPPGWGVERRWLTEHSPPRR